MEYVVNYYHSNILTSDTEGDLVQLCNACADENGDVVEWASNGDTESECELCDVTNQDEWYE